MYSKQEQMQKESPDLTADQEKLLFHGTSSDTVERICMENIDPRCSGKNATAYGEGQFHI